MTDSKQIADGIISYLKGRNQLHLLSQVIILLSQFQNAPVVLVQSAVQLTDTEKKQIESLITRKYPQQTTFHYQLNPDLLGGLKITVGSKELDLSVMGSLKHYEK